MNSVTAWARLPVLGSLAILLLTLHPFGGVSAQTIQDPCRSAGNTSNNGSKTENRQDCSNSGSAQARSTQFGFASSGDGVAGQAAGGASENDAEVDASNRSDDVDVSTGDARGENRAEVQAISAAAVVASAGTITGPCSSDSNTSNSGSLTSTSQDCSNSGGPDAASDQSAEAMTGDGVGGQVIGVVTSREGSANVVAENETTGADVHTGRSSILNQNLVVEASAGTHFSSLSLQ